MDSNKVKEARKYRIYPNKEQQEQIVFTINACREMWNHLLSYVYAPVQELDEIKQLPDKQKSKGLYNYLEGHFEVVNSNIDVKNRWLYSYKDVAKELGIKEKETKELFKENNDVELNGIKIKKVGLLYEDLSVLVKERLNKSKENTPAKIKKQYKRLSGVDSLAYSNVQMQLKAAFKNHFTNPKTFGLPKFKSYRDTQYKGTYSTNHVNVIDEKHLQIPRFKQPVKFVNHYPVPEGSRLYKMTIRRTSSDKYFATLHYEMDKHTSFYGKTNNQIGIDMNTVKHGLVTSNELQFTPPDVTDLNKRLLREKRKLSRRQYNARKMIARLREEAKVDPFVHVPDITEFSRYQKQRVKVAKLQDKITNIHFDWVKKVTSKIIEDYDFVGIEDLDNKAMTKKQKGQGAASSRKLHKAMLDVSFYDIRAKLEYKADWSNKKVIAIDPAYTSKTCFKCQRVNDNLQLSDREWDCPYCGKHLIRDVNAAQNILVKALNQN